MKSLLWTLEDISRLTSSDGVVTETLNNIVHLIQERFGTDVCSIYLLASDRSALVLSATIGLKPESVGVVRMRPDEGLVGLVAQQRRPVAIANASAHPRFLHFPEAGEDLYQTFLGAPMINRGLLEGVLVVQTIQAREFSEDTVSMLATAAAQLAPIAGDVWRKKRQAAEHEVVQHAKAELLQTLAGGVAHELNNKLMPVIGFAELLIDEADPVRHPRFYEYGRTIHESVLEAARIVKQLAEISLPSADEYAEFDFRKVIEQCARLVTLRLKERGVEFVLDLPARPVPIHCDAGQLKQVFVNIVWNAIDAMEGCSDPRIDVRLTMTERVATLSCTDRGAGMTEEVMSRIFDPFFTTKGPTGGTGLGLAMCMGIVKQHGGAIRVSSTVGRGTTFNITLPVHTVPRMVPASAEDAPSPSQALAGSHILVVDDEERVGNIIARVLQTKGGCSVETVRNGLEAQEALARSEFALIVSDIRMPGMNGAELLTWMQTERPDMVARTVFITGDSATSALNEQVRDAGRPILQKPFTLDTLVGVAQRILATT